MRRILVLCTLLAFLPITCISQGCPSGSEGCYRVEFEV